jgi:predicted RNase H-like HicB family nuclease
MPKALAVEGFSLAIEYYREEDGRWLADIAALPGVTAYGRTKKQATAAAEALALRLIADRLEHGEALPGPMNVTFIAAQESISELAVRVGRRRLWPRCCGSAGGSNARVAHPTESPNVLATPISCLPTTTGSLLAPRP